MQCVHLACLDHALDTISSARPHVRACARCLTATHTHTHTHYLSPFTLLKSMRRTVTKRSSVIDLLETGQQVSCHSFPCLSSMRPSASGEDMVGIELAHGQHQLTPTDTPASALSAPPVLLRLSPQRMDQSTLAGGRMDVWMERVSSTGWMAPSTR